MDSQELVSLLKPSTRRCHVNEYRGCTAAVDAHSLILSGVERFIYKTINQEPTEDFIEYSVQFVKMLLHNGLRPIMVFNGLALPVQGNPTPGREEAKSLARERLIDYLTSGDVWTAYKYVRQCTSVGSDVRLNFLKKLREMKIDCIVAPYEAAAQLAFFNRTKIARIVITEDAHVLGFGCTDVSMEFKQSQHPCH